MHRPLKSTKKGSSREQREQLLQVLKARFENNMNRHMGLDWAQVQEKFQANADKLCSLSEMNATGGEPDVVGYDKQTGEYIVYDCSAESPEGCRSLCYDREALQSRKANKPNDSAVDMAGAMGIEVSQRRGILLCRSGVSRLAKGLVYAAPSCH